ncbi:MAG: transcriptional regulator NrdR [Planctomycetota bacterium]|nr:MAG: transcriptional regulator NrdR [Planctomycetota bacterium]
MRCPYCSEADSKVIDSRESENGKVIRRRRECRACGKRFTSYERLEESPVFVIKRDGRREEFSREKIFEGLCRACEKLPISADTLEKVTDRIVFKLRENHSREVKTTDIGELIVDELRALDPVAYVRFVSVYRKFKNPKEFYSLLKGLLQEEEEKDPGEAPPA